ncbi:MAG TPA: hypothetical protein PLH59_06210, partial [Bacilli bacterium]|nr:hypothetical protein [Bacilli bacterium]
NKNYKDVKISKKDVNFYSFFKKKIDFNDIVLYNIYVSLYRETTFNLKKGKRKGLCLKTLKNGLSPLY